MSLRAKLSLLRESEVTFYTTESTCDAKLGVMTTSSVTSQAIMSNSLLKRAKLLKGSSTLVVPHGHPQRRKMQQLLGDGILAKLSGKTADK